MEALKQILSKLGIKVEVLNSLRVIKLFAGNKIEGSLVIDKSTHQELHLHLGDMSKKEATELIKELPGFVQTGVPVLEEEPTKKVREIQRAMGPGGFEVVSKKYGKVVPKEDIPILEASELVRVLHAQGGSVRSYKVGIGVSYGSRGNNICNLYTAGYFENLILPLHEEMVVKGKSTQQEFLEVYKAMVDNFPFAVFVGLKSNHEDLKEEVLNKIAFNQQAGINVLTIHGIGFENIKRIKRLLKEPEVAERLSDEPNIILYGPNNNAAGVIVYFESHD